MVNDSPSISISRRIVLSSLVAMKVRLIHADLVLVLVNELSTPCFRTNVHLIGLSAGEDVVHEPFSLLLTNHCLTNHARVAEHVVGGL
jgi:hypothetical protein